MTSDVDMSQGSVSDDEGGSEAWDNEIVVAASTGAYFTIHVLQVAH